MNRSLQRRLASVFVLATAAFVLAAGAIGLIGTNAGASAGAPMPAANVEVMLVIDTSGSMSPAIATAKAAAGEFVRSMPAAVPVGLVTFGDSVAVLTPPSTDRAQLAGLIDGIVVDGDTALYDAVIAATQQFTPVVDQKVIVLLSDGEDEGSTASLDAAIATLQGVRLEAISVTTEQTDLVSLSALGTVTSADDTAAVAAAFARVADLLVAQIEPAAPSTAPATSVAPTTVAPTTAPPTTAAPTTAAPATTAPSVSSTLAPAAIVSSTGGSSASLWFGAAGVFCGLFLLVMMVFPRARVSKARLGIDTPRSMSDLGKRTMSAVEDVLERRGKRTDFETTLSVADISTPPGEFVSMVGVVALVCGLVGLLLDGPVLGLFTVVTVCLGVNVYVNHRKARRRAAFGEQLPDVLQLVTTALRSGFSLAQGLDSVVEEAEEPARGEFAQVLVETRLGRDLSDAMRALATRMDSQDLEWVVGAIDINRDIGGNLSEILNTVSNTIRERQRMVRQAATYTAEGRLSARILTVLPIVMALWQWRVNPDNFARLTSGSGLVALVIAGLLLVVGSIWTRAIVNSIST